MTLKLIPRNAAAGAVLPEMDVLGALFGDEDPLECLKEKSEPNEGDYITAADYAKLKRRFAERFYNEFGYFRYQPDHNEPDYKTFESGLHRPDARYQLMDLLLAKLSIDTTYIVQTGKEEMYAVIPQPQVENLATGKIIKDVTDHFNFLVREDVRDLNIRRYSKSAVERMGDPFMELPQQARQRFFREIWMRQIEPALYGGPPPSFSDAAAEFAF